MELFPNLEIGWSNGWILIVLFFGAYGMMLVFFPKSAIARLYDRSGQRKYPLLRQLFVVSLVLLWFIFMGLTPLKIGEAVFVIGISIYSLGLIGFLIALYHFKNAPVDQPVTMGLYRFSRHPQQLAFSISFLGISIAIGSWSAFAIIVLGMIGAHQKIIAEEQACLEQYGESYQNYMERIPRYFLFF
ncbi:MAG: isoprenylcysteine carboxylmethyltransferase family protein [Anaerolineales bacterium]|nr:isoprenylcysteine carboxylmethyltransferase family protein [Anaerolineales bacterium]